MEENNIMTVNQTIFRDDENNTTRKIIHTSEKYGDVEIISEIRKHKMPSGRTYDEADFRFTNTGHEFTAGLNSVLRDAIRDPLYKSYFGVGAIGYASSAKNQNEYTRWRKMLKRFYDKSFKMYPKYGGLGFHMCERWLRFDYFLEDLKKYPNYYKDYKENGGRLQLVIKEELLKNGCTEYSFENCELKDEKTEIKFGELYDSESYGKFIPICYVDNVFNNGTCKGVKVKFVDTGYETVVPSSSILDGSIKDKYRPTIYGVGYIGHGTMKDGKNIKERHLWGAMISRCYNPKNKMYYAYGGIGITVCERWHNFGNFLDDLPSLPGYKEWKENNIKYKYNMDKDILQQDIPINERIYSPETCMLIKMEDNENSVIVKQHQNSGRKYYGILQVGNNYRADAHFKGTCKNLGTFTNEDAAANARDWWARWYGIPRLNVDLGAKYMEPEEWMSYRTNTKQLYHLVDPPKKQMYRLINKEGN